MPPATILARVKHTIGRAIRETGQAIDRVGIRGESHAKTTRVIGDPDYIFNDHLSRHRNRMPLLRRGEPKVDDNVAYIAPCSSLIGTVHIGANSSVWYGAVLRADCGNMGCGRSDQKKNEWMKMNTEKRKEVDRDYDDSGGGGGIFIGCDTNIQDGCVVTSNEDHTFIGNGVTVGHMAFINSATVEDNCLIGMGSILNPGSRVESLSLVGAGSVVGRGVVVKSGELWVGNPARKLRDLLDEEKKKLHYYASEYIKVSTCQNTAMDLGGNVPDNLIKKLRLA